MTGSSDQSREATVTGPADQGREASVPDPRRRSQALWPWLRGALVLAAGAALVLGIDRVAGPVSPGLFAAPVTGTPDSRGPLSELVTGAILTCPGPELRGLEDPAVPEPAMTVELSATSAPAEALSDQVVVPESGTLHVDLVPGDDGSTQTERGALLHRSVSQAQGVRITAAAGPAAGLAGAQWHLSRTEERRGMTAAACQPGLTDAWLLAGGAEPGRVERLVLVNPGTDPVTVRADVHGVTGELVAPGGQGIVVPGESRTVLLLDALAQAEESPAVHITTSGGPIVAALGDRWLEGTVDRGLELTTPAAPPARTLVVPAVPVPEAGGHGSVALRVVAPGPSGAIVQVRSLGEDGPARVDNDITVIPPASVVDIDLSDLPEGTHALELTSDEPVTAAVRVEHRPEQDGPSEMAWIPASPPIEQLAGAPLLVHESVTVTTALTVSSIDGAQVEVIATDEAGRSEVSQLSVPAASSATVDVSGATAVWLRPVQGTVHGALVGSDQEAGGGVLIAGMPLAELPLRREVLPAVSWRP